MNDYQKFFDNSPPEDERLMDEAALDWVIRRDGGFTAGEQDDFFEWLAEDARHGEWFTRHSQAFHQFDSLVQWLSLIHI